MFEPSFPSWPCHFEGCGTFRKQLLAAEICHSGCFEGSSPSGSSPPVCFLAHPGVNSSPRNPPPPWTELPLLLSSPHGHSHLKVWAKANLPPWRCFCWVFWLQGLDSNRYRWNNGFKLQLFQESKGNRGAGLPIGARI